VRGKEPEKPNVREWWKSKRGKHKYFLLKFKKKKKKRKR